VREGKTEGTIFGRVLVGTGRDAIVDAEKSERIADADVGVGVETIVVVEFVSTFLFVVAVAPKLAPAWEKKEFASGDRNAAGGGASAVAVIVAVVVACLEEVTVTRPRG